MCVCVLCSWQSLAHTLSTDTLIIYLSWAGLECEEKPNLCAPSGDRVTLVPELGGFYFNVDKITLARRQRNCFYDK